MPDAPPSPPQQPDQYAAAIDSCRGVLKWVLSTFGAIAAILVAGLQLTSVGQLHGTRLVVSVVAFSVAFGSVFWIIMLAIRVLAPTGGTYSEFESGAAFHALRESLVRDQAPLRGKASSAEELAREYTESLKQEGEAYRIAAADPSDENIHKYATATANRQSLYPTLMAITSFGVYLRVRELFDQTGTAIKFLVPVIAVAAVVFAYAANPPKSTTATKPPKSTTATIASGSARFTGAIPLASSTAALRRAQAALPRRCRLPRYAYVINATRSSETLLLRAPLNCASVILTLPSK